ncbi:MAG: hypothetical protein QNJ23_08105 [Woeseiaceae bacterium]|nr:hypothetical protein [Woeseiaceae bacterium]
MAKLRILTLVALILGAFGTATAQNLEMEGTTPAAASDAMPMRGMTAASVESKYGTPDAKVAPVGDPPISRWEYSNFVVFFEYDRVIHAVVKRKQSS